jgi:hypothetical protein
VVASASRDHPAPASAPPSDDAEMPGSSGAPWFVAPGDLMSSAEPKAP